MEQTPAKKPPEPLGQKAIKKAKEAKEAEIFKRKYFDYYDDIKTSVKEDW